MSVDEILTRIEEVCRKHDVDHLLLFGSHARGEEIPTSDIDIAVKGCKGIGVLREDIERIPTLKKIDVIDYDSCKNEFLREAVDRDGKIIY